MDLQYHKNDHCTPTSGTTKTKFHKVEFILFLYIAWHIHLPRAFLHLGLSDI